MGVKREVALSVSCPHCGKSMSPKSGKVDSVIEFLLNGTTECNSCYQSIYLRQGRVRLVSDLRRADLD